MEVDEPWKLIRQLYPDLVLVVGEEQLRYHQAVVAQHSSLLRTLLLQSSCCTCRGAECNRHSSGDIVISLDPSVKTSSVQYVMDMIYAGTDSFASVDSDSYREVIAMLQISTIVENTVTVEAGAAPILPVEEERNVTLEETEDEVSKSLSQELKETNKALRKLKKEQKKLAQAEKFKREEVEKSDRRTRSKHLDSSSGRTPAVVVQDEKKVIVSPAKQFSIEGFADDVQSLLEKSPLKSSSTVEKKSKAIISKVPAKKPSSTLSVSKSSQAAERPKDDLCLIIDLDAEPDTKPAAEEKYCCPYKDCVSESKNAQSIKVHLALVHYKKAIQSEFPNWKRQKCDECNKSFGQMTAYYLHMANHKKYEYMDLPAQALLATAPSQPAGQQSQFPAAASKPSAIVGVKPTKSFGTITRPASLVQSPLPANNVARNRSRSFTPSQKSFGFVPINHKTSPVTTLTPGGPVVSKIVRTGPPGPQASFSAGTSTGPVAGWAKPGSAAPPVQLPKSGRRLSLPVVKPVGSKDNRLGRGGQ